MEIDSRKNDLRLKLANDAIKAIALSPTGKALLNELPNGTIKKIKDTGVYKRNGSLDWLPEEYRVPDEGILELIENIVDDISLERNPELLEHKKPNNQYSLHTSLVARRINQSINKTIINKIANEISHNGHNLYHYDTFISDNKNKNKNKNDTEIFKSYFEDDKMYHWSDFGLLGTYKSVCGRLEQHKKHCVNNDINTENDVKYSNLNRFLDNALAPFSEKDLKENFASLTWSGIINVPYHREQIMQNAASVPELMSLKKMIKATKQMEFKKEAKEQEVSTKKPEENKDKKKLKLPFSIFAKQQYNR